MRFTILFILSAMAAISFPSEAKTELEKVVCLYFIDRNDDPTLSVSFKGKENDFVQVKIDERFESRFTHDTKWVEIYKNDEQMATSEKAYTLGIEGFSLEIQRPIPSWNSARKDNAKLDLGNGTVLSL
ncbi:MAG: hypothetical protein HYR96_11995, partial [Deltaproteobacteria bacterium]|nr:hypothetical protein [Deltaproteobacteria bacterium]